MCPQGYVAQDVAPLSVKQKEYFFGFAYERFGEEQNLKIRLIVASRETLHLVSSLVKGDDETITIDMERKTDLSQRAKTLRLMYTDLECKHKIQSLIVSVPICCTAHHVGI
eukprot:TRINITY_DN5414_c0_g1_i7.p1 TRINITY_DN5414_c0_g1~~TRINITY_DN5414_c0_g1_i7.p1  ORF type:complete len:111 (-),score=23.15 TRINITY_DN5414_c0_g1_i7:124-456(-)